MDIGTRKIAYLCLQKKVLFLIERLSLCLFWIVFLLTGYEGDKPKWLISGPIFSSGLQQDDDDLKKFHYINSFVDIVVCKNIHDTKSKKVAFSTMSDFTNIYRYLKGVAMVKAEEFDILTSINSIRKIC